MTSREAEDTSDVQIRRRVPAPALAARQLRAILSRMENSKHFDLVRAKMEQMTRDMTNQLNRDLFRSIMPSRPLPPLTWRERLRRRLDRMHRYCSTLWDALRGRDPYDVDPDY